MISSIVRCESSNISMVFYNKQFLKIFDGLIDSLTDIPPIEANDLVCGLKTYFS